ncbi:MAG: SurA N-terminal domain-containing protein [Oligoflexia bacterium]|nr:SurA N-terminal domain-containing protein [Oligoflexia bacterium]
MKKYFYPLLLLAAGYIVYHTVFRDSEIKPGAGTIAIVNDVSIPASDFIEKYNDVRSHYSTSQDADLTEIKETILRRMIIDSLILQEAKDKNIVVSDEELDRYISNIKQNYTEEEFKQILINQFKTDDSWVEEIAERLLIEKTLSKVVIEKIDISENEIEAYYKKFYSERVREPKIRLAQIFTLTRTDAEKAMEKLSAGMTFAETASMFSVSPEAGNAGVVGVIGKGESIELFDAAFSMEEGETSGIMQSDYGFHILKVLEYIPLKKVSLAEAKPYILNEITKEKESEIYEKWLKHRFANSRIIKNVALIESIK